MDWRECSDRMVSLLFPKTCVLCGEVVAYEDLWCGKCETVPLDQMNHEAKHPPSLQGAMAPFLYTGRIRSSIIYLKEHNDSRLVEYFSREMLRCFAEQGGCADIIVPVPSHPGAQREKGFNHAALLARGLAGKLNLPVEENALERWGEPVSQHQLQIAQRWENAQSAYHAGRGETVKGKRVLLVDDVFTTGATADACARCLLGAGAISVVVLTVAVTPRLSK